jgi:CheY-like chemotaxis protein
VYSEIGHGTSFKIFLPRVDAAAQPILVASAPSITSGTGTILVAEDEAGVRQIMRRVLETRGYTVLTARDGGEAMAMAEGHRGTIDLLMSDVVMPDMNGRELARRLTAVRPTLQVLFLSGYTDDAIFQHGVLQPGVFFLQKPFSPGDLARKVQDVLAARSSAA